jgi:beta-glucanase (GH16 family)
MKPFAVVRALLPGLLLLVTNSGCRKATATAPVAPPADLIWSDEFTGAAGTAPASTRWKYEVGGSGWGNQQLEYDTNRTSNASLDGAGNLVITARAEQFQGNNYTSARLNTIGLFSQAYGRFEARIKLPTGQGIWPAFWMLGANIAQVSWPACGEIDVMEMRGQTPNKVIGSAHGPGYSGGGALSTVYTLPSGSFADGFHVFSVDWTPSRIEWRVDGNLYKAITPASLPSNTTWVYDHPFSILLNLAVGGTFLGNPDASTVFPQSMIVDYVRVYRINA